MNRVYLVLPLVTLKSCISCESSESCELCISCVIFGDFDVILEISWNMPELMVSHSMTYIEIALHLSTVDFFVT